MSSPRITLSVSGAASGPNPPRLTLEQKAVPTGSLSLIDLANMLALVRSGVSAKAYIAHSCPATLQAGIVSVPLTLYAWPSHRQEYRLSAAIPAWTTIGDGEAIDQEREFDLVVQNTDTVDLPCLAGDCSISWQSPALRINGTVIDPPEISGYDLERSATVPLSAPHGPLNRIKLATACFGVLRVSCRAIGYQHAVTMAIPKGAATKVSDIKEIITAAWQLDDGSNDTATQNIALPVCIETLLEACEDGSSVGNHIGSVRDEEALVPRLRWSTCTGKPLGVDWFKP